MRLTVKLLEHRAKATKRVRTAKQMPIGMALGDVAFLVLTIAGRSTRIKAKNTAGNGKPPTVFKSAHHRRDIRQNTIVKSTHGYIVITAN